jgi:hypothetical protein
MSKSVGHSWPHVIQLSTIFVSFVWDGMLARLLFACVPEQNKIIIFFKIKNWFFGTGEDKFHYEKRIPKKLKDKEREENKCKSKEM